MLRVIPEKLLEVYERTGVKPNVRSFYNLDPMLDLRPEKIRCCPLFVQVVDKHPDIFQLDENGNLKHFSIYGSIVDELGLRPSYVEGFIRGVDDRPDGYRMDRVVLTPEEEIYANYDTGYSDGKRCRQILIDGGYISA